MSLPRVLGLRQDEEFECRVKDGLLLVPAMIGADKTELLLDTGAQGGVVLDLDYAAQRGLPISGAHKKPSAFDAEHWRNAGVTQVDRLTALGRTVHRAQLSVCELLSATDPLRGEVAGYLGPTFVNQGLLAMAADQRTVGFSESADLREALKSAVVSINLLPVRGDFLPFTTDIHDALLPAGDPPVTLLDTGSRGSILNIGYLRKKKGHRILRWFLERAYRRGAPASWTFELPSGLAFRTRVRLREFSPAYVQGTGMERVDAIVGMDFFSSWVAAFSFSTGVVALFAPG